jgi:hypothetical protein
MRLHDRHLVAQVLAADVVGSEHHAEVHGVELCLQRVELLGAADWRRVAMEVHGRILRARHRRRFADDGVARTVVKDARRRHRRRAAVARADLGHARGAFLAGLDGHAALLAARLGDEEGGEEQGQGE